MKKQLEDIAVGDWVLCGSIIIDAVQTNGPVQVVTR